MGNTEFEEGSAEERLSAWRSVVVNGIARATALLFLPAVIWLLIDAARFTQIRAFWALLLFELSSIAAALVPVTWRQRARWLIFNQLAVLWAVVPFSGPTGGVGALILLVTLESALLLGRREGVWALLIAAVGLSIWPLQALFGGAARPLMVFADTTNPITALRINFVVLSIASVVLTASTYIVRKLTRTLFEAEALIKNLRSEMAAREEEERRRKSAEADLLRAQKLEILGNVAGGVAHDVNNNLTVTLTCVELIERRAAADDATTRKWCEAIRHAVENASGLTRQLLTLGRRDLSRPALVDVTSVFQRLERILPSALGRDVRLTMSAPSSLPPVFLDPAQLEQVLLNLAINARDAMPKGGELTVMAEPCDRALPYRFTTRAELPGGAIRIRVSDTGEGIDDAVLPKVLEPFFTTKSPGRGTGLGLAVARAFSEAIGGRLCIATSLGSGSTFALEIPAASEDVQAAQPARLVPSPSRVGAEVVLVVDDDSRIREAIAAELRHGGYRVLEAGDGIEALERAKELPHVDLLCTDVVMPRLGGEKLLRLFHELHAQASILVCSAYVDEQKLRELLQAGHYHVLPKPFSPGELRRAVARALAPVDVNQSVA